MITGNSARDDSFGIFEARVADEVDECAHRIFQKCDTPQRSSSMPKMMVKLIFSKFKPLRMRAIPKMIRIIGRSLGPS
jgi:hypothetical protein